MVDYVLDYLEEKSLGCESPKQYESLVKGIKFFLYANGIDEDEERTYFKTFTNRVLDQISREDMVDYLINYETFFEIEGIVGVFMDEHAIAPELLDRLYNMLTKINGVRNGWKYLPQQEIEMILKQYK